MRKEIKDVTYVVAEDRSPKCWWCEESTDLFKEFSNSQIWAKAAWIFLKYLKKLSGRNPK